MKRYEKYITIPSTVSPEMPESWTAKKLKFVLSYSKGKQPSQLTEEPIGDPYATMDYLRGRDCILQYPVSTEGLVHIDNDSLLVLWDGANAGEFLRGKDGYLGSTMAVVKAGDIVDKSYLFYLLKGSEALSKMIAGGTTIPHFSPSFFDEIFAIPSLDEQHKIVAFLDYKTGKIDRLTEMLTARIDDLKKYRQSVITDAVTKGLDKVAEMKDSGISWIGGIPVGWQAVKTKFVLTGLQDGTHGTFQRFDQGYPLLSAKNVLESGIHLSDSESYISKEDYQSIVKNGFPQKGDVALCCVGSIGRCCLYDYDYPIAFQRSVSFLRANHKIVPAFLCYFTKGEMFQHQLISNSKTSIQSGIYLNDVANTYVLLPSLSEQQSIVDYLDRKTKQIDDTIAATDQQIKDLQAYRASLISEAVIGQIDVRDWTAPEE